MRIGPEIASQNEDEIYMSILTYHLAHLSSIPFMNKPADAGLFSGNSGEPGARCYLPKGHLGKVQAEQARQKPPSAISARSRAPISCPARRRGNRRSKLVVL